MTAVPQEPEPAAMTGQAAGAAFWEWMDAYEDAPHNNQYEVPDMQRAYEAGQAVAAAQQPQADLLSRLRTVLLDLRTNPTEARIQALHLLDVAASPSAGEQSAPDDGLFWAWLDSYVDEPHNAQYEVDDLQRAFEAGREGTAQQPQPAPGLQPVESVHLYHWRFDRGEEFGLYRHRADADAKAAEHAGEGLSEVLSLAILGRPEPQPAPDVDVALASLAADRNQLRIALSRIAMGQERDPSVAADKALVASSENARREPALSALEPQPAPGLADPALVLADGEVTATRAYDGGAIVICFAPGVPLDRAAELRGAMAAQCDVPVFTVADVAAVGAWEPQSSPVTVRSLAAALAGRQILVDVDQAERSGTGDGMWLVAPADPHDLAVQLLSAIGTRLTDDPELQPEPGRAEMEDQCSTP